MFTDNENQKGRPAMPREAWQIEQGQRCSCQGSDDYCPCQNVSPYQKKDLKMDFQKRVDEWLIACFGEKIARDKIERNHRFLEEALELVQAVGCTKDEALQLVDYVFDRPKGDPDQEVGGVMNTLAALCLSHDINMQEAGDREMDRVWTKIEKIRAKQAAKPKFSPLPQ